MCEKVRRYNALGLRRTLPKSMTMCAARQKFLQKQPPDRRTMCALLSCHRSVVVPASLPCALHVTLGRDRLRRMLDGLITAFPGRSERQQGACPAFRLDRMRAP